jgi:hypothetical protein
MISKYCMRVTLKTIEESIAPLGGRASYGKDFIFELLTAYGRSAGNITRLKNGSLNVAEDKERDVVQKNIVFFRPVTNEENLYAVIDTLKSDQAVVRYSTRFVIVTDYKQLLAIDTKTNETLDLPIREIDKYFTFFLPWAGMEKAQYVGENHADIKAAYKMSKLFDEIVSFNHHTSDANYYHGLNVFFSRLLFCFFAEDTEIFEKGQFTRGIESHTQSDGSDLAEYLDELFFALDAEDKDGYPAHIGAFPYVNGGLFHADHESPKFNAKARQLLVEGGSLDWSDINPDIFGSMIQAVVNPGQRAGLGMHYTSVPNIMKTIEPLFLDELKEEFNKHYDDKNKLERLLSRIGSIKVFDPACGSGNFLVIAYKELRKLEHALLQRIDELSVHHARLEMFSRINIENFYGIEIDDFAHEVAILSLWLAKHQMNLEFKQKFGAAIPLIPLRESGNIVHGNAARLDWNKICPNEPRVSRNTRLEQSKLIADDHEQAQLIDVDTKEWSEIYLISNPPYLGSSLQKKSQKDDMKQVLGDFSSWKNLDYIAIWFRKGADYIRNTGAALAFVSTNSVTQGEQVSMLWPEILIKIEIGYAYRSFKWANSAKNSAGVTVAIISLRNIANGDKYIYENGLRNTAQNINAYLLDAPDTYFYRRREQISGLPECVMGNKPTDGGNLILDATEYQALLSEHPEASKFLKKFTGAGDYVNGSTRYCLWIDDNEVDEAIKIRPIAERLKKVSDFRAGRTDTPSTVEYAKYPHRFRQRSHKNSQFIIVPSVTSERREYIPIGYQDNNTIASNAANVIYDAPLWVFGIISSKMHMAWVRVVAGQLETRIRYSSAIVYNNFPVPALSTAEKQSLETKVYDVLDVRERHSEQTLAELYDPDKMPEDLRISHNELDKVVDSIYRKKPFANDEERLAHLFEFYEQLKAKEKDTILS